MKCYEHASPGHQVIPPIGCCLRLMVYLNVNGKLVKKQKKRIRDEPLKISICKWAMSSWIFVEEKDQPLGLGGLHCCMFNSGGLHDRRYPHNITHRMFLYTGPYIFAHESQVPLPRYPRCSLSIALLKNLSVRGCYMGTLPSCYLFCLFALCHDASLQIRKALIFA